MIKYSALGLGIFCLFIFSKFSLASERLNLTPAELNWIGQRIYQNEAHQNPKYLTHWNAGEAFPSFGIGHFIWYPKEIKHTYVETFPKMVVFVSKTIKPPVWLQTLKPFSAPWKNKQTFDQAWAKPRLKSLRAWLLKTQPQQAEFIYAEFLKRWQQVLIALPIQQQKVLTDRLNALTQFKEGRFAVLDYFNFKGIGGNLKEQYRHQGWGLIEVLKALPNGFNKKNVSKASNQVKLKQFVVVAKKILLQRIQNAPPTRKEQRWQKGWFNRLDGYLK